uniref:Uncharacterized protein n=1 Tax=Arundo donax TaxID=35708 RepID=A0A0A9HG46_ARUDO
MGRERERDKEINHHQTSVEFLAGHAAR